VPSRQEHIDKARYNGGVARRLEAIPVYDWAVTTMFYSALHLVDAVLAANNIHPTTHADRNNRIQRNPALAAHWRDYRHLRDRSEDARYRCLPFTAIDVNATRANSYAPIWLSLAPLLGLSTMPEAPPADFIP